jgi:hypothetical protein
MPRGILRPGGYGMGFCSRWVLMNLSTTNTTSAEEAPTLAVGQPCANPTATTGTGASSLVARLEDIQDLTGRGGHHFHFATLHQDLRHLPKVFLIDIQGFVT